MWLLVGLGNPGPKYERNRHNIGFRVVDELARRHGLGAFRGKFGGEVASGMLSLAGRHHKAVLLKPMEYMNLSGHAVQRAVHFHDVEPGQIVVIHDDLDIDFGRLKLKAGGGHGGHNGLRSIIQQLGNSDFLRVRVGIGKPGPGQQLGEVPRGNQAAAGKDRRVAGYVLSDFPSALASQVDQLIDDAAAAAEAIVAHGIRAAMNQIHAPTTNSLPGDVRA
ncbi:aminoacyl-tRNA hydrolase [Haliangium sp.]|uniref:aminoacyl-tRNA hydrolase n=1 Tax=Haliangium sp. TaxID=2663208 RepID=UPI003D097BE1